ncbi:replication protein A 70 kDa DNA-binding subunit-like [Rhizophagus clarus]|uniref:Replication protein A 70 kDa DNA-binding subunit-like n=1 Tax=Rhizophagus clarus TaxID=94130 RepID=A0A8H3QH09_9GLOM|nr:replication protein A 70 kDa DNA-binding subunit-like [Rhizophagus clarus]
MRNSRQTQSHQEMSEQNQIDADNLATHVIPSATNISEDDRRVLQKKKKLRENDENQEEEPKRFSKENNMDPGDVPEELQGLTEIKEMLIAQVFMVMSVYRLQGEQHEYRENVINFPQDVQEFTTHLPHHLSSLNILIVRCQSANDSMAFRDFKPEINSSPINEFQMVRYIVHAFLTLYLTGQADLHAERVKDIKPAKYFRHLMWYKDEKVYVKQNLNDKQLDVAGIQEMIAGGDKQLTDQIMRYGEGLRRTQQFWMAQRRELSDMIKQIGHQGFIFSTFSVADFHWPKLHKLMPDNGTNGSDSTK